ncbi:hypothetical protein SEA_JACKO_11 [Microbacterium phage Jacko]|nr:hypothetical protein SEA_JACKO_11 [Microbacterium phage Jacko]
MTTAHPHHPDNCTNGQKKAALISAVYDAIEEQRYPERVDYLIPGEPFEMRINRTEARERLTNLLKYTEALELLGEILHDYEAGVE